MTGDEALLKAIQIMGRTIDLIEIVSKEAAVIKAEKDELAARVDALEKSLKSLTTNFVHLGTAVYGLEAKAQ